MFKQVQLFVNHILKNGASPDIEIEIEIEIAHHHLNKEWRGKIIAKVKD